MPSSEKSNTRARQFRKAAESRTRGKYRPRRRLGGGGLPDVVNPRTRKLEYGRILKPDRKS